jgi:TrmH family RNA methyltransferase
MPEKVAYIVGNEIDGVSKELLAVSDVVVDIPMAGEKESLNVGVATGIVLFYR